MSETVQLVKNYYGKTLQSGKDLLTDACCTTDTMPAHVRPLLSKVHPEVRSKYYGCGLVVPEKLEGCQVLDLGCGAGQDCYLLSGLVGPHGKVVGVDMTQEQLEVAQRHRDFHREAFGYDVANTEFHLGYLERLEDLPLPSHQFDVIVSNCVINLCEDKGAVLRACHRLLKPGGELYFSDVYSDRRVPEELRSDPVLYGECLSGALYHHDFQNLAAESGFPDVRKVTGRPLTIQNADVLQKLGPITFQSVTYRLFQCERLEPQCEDYGQAVKYRGTIATNPQTFCLDQSTCLEAGRVTPVCGNTFEMLRQSRFADDFEFFGSRERHFGPFDCGTGSQSKNRPSEQPAGTTVGTSTSSCC